MKMKKIFFLMFLLPCILWAEKFNIEVVFRPAVVAAGEPVEVILISNKRGNLSFELPEIKGGRWLKNYISSSTQTSIVNGVVSTTVRRTIPILTETPGAITIPPFTVKCGKESAQTRELVIKVLASSDRAAAPGSALPPPRGEITVPAKGRVFYVGEEIPLELSLLIPVGLEVRELSYPELSGLGSAVLTDYSKVNPRNRFFAPPAERRRVVGNGEFVEVLFKTSFRALKRENIVPKAVAQLGIVHRSRSRTPRSMFDDDFFDGFFSSSSARVIPRQVDFKFLSGKIDIQPLPPLKSNSHFLNLVGPWLVSVKLGSTTAKVGEPVELTVTLTGEGSGETLTAPTLQIPGFRIYPPEVKRYPGKIEIKYALIPLEVGERKMAPSFAVFDPVKGRYVISRQELVLPVSAGNAPQAAVVVSQPEKSVSKAVPVEREKKKEEKIVRSELFYQKSAPGSSVALPLMNNQWGKCVFVLVLGILSGGFFRWRKWQKDRAENDSGYRMKNELHHQLKDVLEELKMENYSADKVRETAVPFLAQALGLPPGSSPEEVAEKVEDQELAAWLRTLNFSGFMPGSGSSDSQATAVRIKSLIKALKRYGVIVLSLGAFTLEAGFNTAFEAGKYDLAEKEYSRFVSKKSWSSHALYNLGGVYYMKNDLPMARLCLLRAHLIAPMDTETLENLNLINRKLMQPEMGLASTPWELFLWCRDRLRPDQYIFLFCCTLAGLMILGGLKKRSSGSVWYWSLGILVLAALLFIAAAVSQNAGLYSRHNAIVISRGIKLRSFPAESGKVEATLPGGGSAWIVETRDHWSRIRINGQDGWVKSEDIRQVFPEGSL